MKRGLVLCLLIVLVATNISFVAAQDDVTIRILGFESCITEGLQLQADAYMEVNPNVTVEVERTAYTVLRENQIFEMASGSGTYDIYSVVTEWVPEYINAGYLEALNDYVEANPPEGAMGMDDLDQVWTPGLLNFEMDADGNLYGFPGHDGPQLFYYRTDLFEDEDNKAAFEAEYGYELTNPETWDQFLDAATFFTDEESGMWGTVQTAKFGEQQLAQDFWLLLPSFGGGTGLDENGVPNFNGEAGVQTLQFYADLINEYKVSPEASLTYGIPEAGDLYLSGGAAMHFNWAHIGANAELEDLSSIVGNNGFSTIPHIEGAESAIVGSYWINAIAASSQNKDAAYDFMVFAAQPEIDKLMAEPGCIPTRLSSWNDPELLEKFPFFATFEPSYQGFVTSAPRVPEFELINDAMQRHISEALAGDVTVQEALDAAAEEVTEILRDGGHIE